MTLELGRMSTCRFPDFSALLMALSASLRTLVLTIVADVRFSTRWWEVRYLSGPEIHVSRLSAKSALKIRVLRPYKWLTESIRCAACCSISLV